MKAGHSLTISSAVLILIVGVVGLLVYLKSSSARSDQPTTSGSKTVIRASGATIDLNNRPGIIAEPPVPKPSPTHKSVPPKPVTPKPATPDSTVPAGSSPIKVPPVKN